MTADRPPRHVYFYKDLRQSNRDARIHFSHFANPPAILPIREDIDYRTPQTKANYSMAAMYAEFIVKTVPLQAQLGIVTEQTKEFLKKTNPTTRLTNRELLDLAGQSDAAERLVLRTTSNASLLETPPPQKLAVGGILGIREHLHFQGGQILALEGESLGVAVNEKHELATAEKFIDNLTDRMPPKTPLDIPQEITIEILQAYIDAQVLILQAQNDRRIRHYLTDKQLDLAYRWLDNVFYGQS